VYFQFKKIIGGLNASNCGLMEDYWFGHRIHHGSGAKVNVKVIEGYIIKTCKKINIGEELSQIIIDSCNVVYAFKKVIFSLMYSRSI
jgi:hypothetical protein